MASSSFSFLLVAALLGLASWKAIASDPSPLQDFCVADLNSPGTFEYVLNFMIDTLISCIYDKQHIENYYIYVFIS